MLHVVPCMSLCRCENTRGAERQIRFLVYSLELASRRADESGELARRLPIPRNHLYTVSEL